MNDLCPMENQQLKPVRKPNPHDAELLLLPSLLPGHRLAVNHLYIKGFQLCDWGVDVCVCVSACLCLCVHLVFWNLLPLYSAISGTKLFKFSNIRKFSMFQIALPRILLSWKTFSPGVHQQKMRFFKLITSQEFVVPQIAAIFPAQIRVSRISQ